MMTLKKPDRFIKEIQSETLSYGGTFVAEKYMKIATRFQPGTGTVIPGVFPTRLHFSSRKEAPIWAASLHGSSLWWM